MHIHVCMTLYIMHNIVWLPFILAVGYLKLIVHVCMYMYTAYCTYAFAECLEPIILPRWS